VLWGEKELAVFIQCIGMPDETVEKVFKSSFKGAAQLLETMANIETCKELGFTSPLHRLIVRRCLQRLLESDRLENSARGRTLRDVLSDTVLNAHIIPIRELILEEKLSQGGFGTVFKGSLCLSTKRVGLSAGREYKVAAKAMSVSGGHQMRLYELLKEARVMASLDHPNICKFIGVCADTRPQGQRFIVSELMSGSLFDLIHRPTRIAVNAGLGIPEAVSLSQGISAGLAYIHQHNLVHADLKSSNILISISMHTDACYVPRICDFGHAAVRAEPSPHSRLCTFQWAAPEALRCENLGPAADVFSFGTILWEMLAHRVPHSDLAIGQIQAYVGWGKLVPDMKLLPLLPEELFQLLGDCLQFQQEERPSAKEVHQQLLRLPATARKEALRHVRMFFGQERRESSAGCLQGVWHHILKSIGWKPDIL
jgi:serine/threonine protein kinase